MKRSKNAFPKAWDERRVRALAEYYDQQTEDEAVREYETSHDEPSQTVITVPTRLVPVIRSLISLATTRRKQVRQACKAPVKGAVV